MISTTRFLLRAARLHRGTGLLPIRTASTNVAEMKDYEYETLSVSSPKDYVLHIELNRPEKLNAMNITMWTEMTECFNKASKDSNVRAVVVSGKGRMFTAGLDLMASAGNLTPKPELDTARNAYRLMDFIRFAQESMSCIEKCSKPSLVAIHSGCIGGGIDLATACDVRLCTKDAYFCVKEVDVGLAADIGTLQRLPKVIGNDSLARELCYTARKMESEEANKCGLVSHVFDDKDAMIENAITMASLIASKSPVAVQSTKHHLNYSRDHTVQEGLDYMVAWNSAMLQSEDIMKSAEAFMMKKTPADVVFSKL